MRAPESTTVPGSPADQGHLDPSFLGHRRGAPHRRIGDSHRSAFGQRRSGLQDDNAILNPAGDDHAAISPRRSE